MTEPFFLPTKAPTTPCEAVRFSWTLTWQAYRHLSLCGRLMKCGGRALASLAHHREFSEWVGFLLQPDYRPYATANTLIWQRPLRGYLSTRWGGAKKLKVLKDSYRFAQAHPGPLREALLRSDFVVIAEVPLGKELGNLEIALGRDPRFRREGEWCLRVNCPALGGHLCTIAFAVEEIGGEWVAYAGAIQGGEAANEETIKASAKAMHGIRAKAMAILALQSVARSLGIRRLYGDSNAIQISRRKHLVPVPWNRISFDYDQMWSEAGGKPAGDGWYELPIEPARRTREEIKPNKRPLYARRYALLDQLSTAIAIGLAVM